ncbi:MAG: PAS domain S-box protein, partial [Syntrophaceae bacterium]
NSALLFLSVSLAAFFIALAVSRKITNPVRTLRARALALGRGEEPEQVRLNDISEFQDLAEAFNTMAGKVQARETALLESEERYRTIVESANEGIWKVDAESMTTYVNKKMAEMLGYSPQEMIGRSAFDFMDEESKALVTKRLEHREKGVKGSYERKFVRKDGTPIWTIVNVVSLKDRDGKIAGWIGLLTDITDRKRIDEALRLEREQLLSLFDSMDALIYVTDPSTNEILYVNKAMKSQFGKQAAGGICYREFQGLEAPCPFCTNEIILRQNPAPHYWEYFNPQIGRHFSIIDRIIKWPDDRNVRFEIATDITERKQAEDALRKAKDDLEERVRERTRELHAESLYARSLIEASLDPLVTISVDGKITDVSRATEEATGVSRERLVGSDFSDYFTEPQKARAGYEEVFRRGFVRDYPLELKHRDGQVTPVLYNATLYRDEKGQNMGVFAAARDITIRKRAEETVKAERQRLYDVLETLPVYVILLTPDYHVPFANRFFRERFGESRGKRCFEYLFTRTEPCEICESFTVQKTGKRHHWEWMGPDGRNYDIFDFPFTDFDGSPLIMEVGIDITLRKQAEAALRKLAAELVMAEERERKRIAGVLHDDIAQILAAARMRLGLLQGIPPDPKNTQTLEEIKSLISQSIQETRALMNDLGNPLLFDMGLQAACEALASSLMERHPIRVTCDIRDAFKHVNPDVKTILYQLIRELLNNVVKHSQAQNAHVLLDMENGYFRAKVTDDGVGFDPERLGAPTAEGGFGLYSIRERLIAIDGSLRIESAPGSGTIVTAILPEALD